MTRDALRARGIPERGEAPHFARHSVAGRVIAAACLARGHRDDDRHPAGERHRARAPVGIRRARRKEGEHDPRKRNAGAATGLSDRTGARDPIDFALAAGRGRPVRARLFTNRRDTVLDVDPKLEAFIRRRRTFAIISHPDAGKTTLTEKLLLYGGAIHLAGAVKSRRSQRHAASDWMKMEQERGISVTSSVMQFEYAGYQINLLDTPGHGDFSEDTYRTLVAADSAVMLLDNRKGVEERTRQLFEVCKRRRMPIFTFVNKCDRPGEDPLKLISDVEADLGIACHFMTWPIQRDGVFAGVYDRRSKLVHLFGRGEDHGASRVEDHSGPLDSPDIIAHLGPEAHEQLLHDIQLLDEAGHPFDHAALLDGQLTPVFFGSALTNFGLEPFLEEF